ncbi:hypothetical protein GBA52_012427 [Prunus armeniaca]|nr:hypothetical protein GBA52_012427 [Prunus armeniaca]
MFKLLGTTFGAVHFIDLLSAAHWIARLSLHGNGLSFWMDEGPPSLIDSVHDDWPNSHVLS